LGHQGREYVVGEYVHLMVAKKKRKRGRGLDPNILFKGGPMTSFLLVGPTS
jgi:hypothetical protein